MLYDKTCGMPSFEQALPQKQGNIYKFHIKYCIKRVEFIDYNSTSWT